MQTTTKIEAYAMALDSDIAAEPIKQVRDGKLWRGWMGTIYGCGVATDKGALFESRAEAVDNAKMMREQCRAIVRAAAKLGRTEGGE